MSIFHAKCRCFTTFKRPYFRSVWRYSQIVGRAGSATGTVHANVTLTRFNVKVKVTGLLNFQKLAKLCMHAGGDDRQPTQPPSGAFWLHIWKLEWMPSASKLFTYLFYMWHKYDVTVTFTTSMSCDSVCCMCGEASSSRWLMTQSTNDQHALRACVRANGGHFEHTMLLSIIVFSVLEFYVSHPARLMHWVIF